MADHIELSESRGLADKTLVCRDCGITFVFTAGEQEFYQEKGLLHAPQRCPSCRANRRRERNGQPPREMHQVTCAECGVQTMVPFLPRQDRPVYCSTCFDRVRMNS
jgi:CxxC-x17-CxxC domain-containing protein